MSEDTVTKITGDVSGVHEAAAEADAALHTLANQVNSVNQNLIQENEKAVETVKEQWHGGLRQVQRSFHELFLPLGIATFFAAELNRITETLVSWLTERERDVEASQKRIVAGSKAMLEASLKDYKDFEDARKKLTQSTADELNKIEEARMQKDVEGIGAASKAALRQIGRESVAASIAQSVLLPAWLRAAKLASDGLREDQAEAQRTADEESQRLLRRSELAKAHARKEIQDKADKDRADANQKALDDEREQWNRHRDRQQQDEVAAGDRLKRAKMKLLSEEEQARVEMEMEIEAIRRKYTEQGRYNPAAIEKERLAVLIEYEQKLEEIEKKKQDHAKQDEERHRREVARLKQIQSEFDRLKAQQESLSVLFLQGTVGDAQLVAMENFLRARGR